MYWKSAFINTLRENPSEAELISHKLMIRSSMIQKLAAGIYNYLPLGLRVIRKIENIIRAEMENCGAVELLMPMVIPAGLWQQSGRWDYYGRELLRIKDRKNNDFCLGPTHEEVVLDIARRSIKSYKDLPICLYQIQTKFRDEVRPRYGLMRGREFIMKDAYSFHVDHTSLDEMYWNMYRAYTNIFNSCGLKFRPVQADSGSIGGDETHEFHVLADSGEDTIVFCEKCDYAANIERAIAMNFTETTVTENAPLILPVKTPGQKSIDKVATFMKKTPNKLVKMLVYEILQNDGSTFFCGVCIRGDLELNEIKLKNYYNAVKISVPSESLLRTKGLAVGYLGAHSVDKTIIKEMIADTSILTIEDGVCGANEEGMHFDHVYPKRDLSIDNYTDLRFVLEGEICPECNHGKLSLRKGIEVGQVFKLGSKYSRSMNMTVLAENDEQTHVVMGCYGIGVGRTFAAAIEQNNDKDGIIWPISIAPFTVALLCLDPNDEKAMYHTKIIHDSLEKHGVDVIVDDRQVRPGIKFKDCDLIGFPIRVVVGSRGLKDGNVEIKRRDSSENNRVLVDDAVSVIMKIIKE